MGKCDQEATQEYYASLVDLLTDSHITVERGPHTLRIQRTFFDPIDKEHIFTGLIEPMWQWVKASPEDRGNPPVIQEWEEGDMYIGSDGICVLTSKKANPAKKV